MSPLPDCQRDGDKFELRPAAAAALFAYRYKGKERRWRYKALQISVVGIQKVPWSSAIADLQRQGLLSPSKRITRSGRLRCSELPVIPSEMVNYLRLYGENP